jgi:ATP-binding cassette subfamily F protein uup
LLVSHDRLFLDRVVTSLLVVDGSGAVREFVGGYSDWLRYRASQGVRAPERSAAPRKRSAGKPPAVATRPRLSQKDRREFEVLPATIESLEAEQAAVAGRMAAAGFYDGERAAISATLQQAAQLGEQIEAAYVRWAELEALSGSAE